MRYPPTEWHHGPGVQQIKTDDSVDKHGKPNYHGTCVASKAAGWYSGVSKYSQLVIMKYKLDVYKDTLTFFQVRADVMDKHRQGKAVVVYPRTSKEVYPTPIHAWETAWKIVRLMMEDLFRENVTIIASAGNEASVHGYNLNTLPAAWADGSLGFPLITAGAVTDRGQSASFSKGRQGPSHDLITFWAPGENIRCAGEGGSVLASDTSFSAPMVNRVKVDIGNLC